MENKVQNPMQGDLQKAQRIIDEYAQKFGAIVDETGLMRYSFSLFKPHNMSCGLDQKGIRVVLSFNDAVPGMMVHPSDSSGQGGMVLKEADQRGLSYEEYAEFFLPASLLTMSDSERAQVMEEIARKELEQEWQSILGQNEALHVSEGKLRGFLHSAPRSGFIQAIIVPLLREMGFEKVRQAGYEGRVLAFGEDIGRIKFCLPTKQYLYCAVHAEAGEVDLSVSSTSQGIEDVLAQIEQAFEHPIFDYDLYTSVYVDHAMLIASGRITRPARVHLQENLQRKKGKNLMFIDQDDLVELCQQNGLPGEIQKLIEG